jgi:hypothetical protein
MASAISSVAQRLVGSSNLGRFDKSVNTPHTVNISKVVLHRDEYRGCILFEGENR